MKKTKIILIVMTAVLALSLAAFTACGQVGEPPAGTYTVTFDSQGGSAVQSLNVLGGEYATQPDDPEKDGKVFLYWSDTVGGERFLFSAHKITGNITLYAVWSDYYTVTFDSQGGSDIDPQKVAEGGYARQPSRPEKAGSYFLYWSEEPNGEDNFLFTSRTITHDITLYAVWRDDAYVVTFDTQGGSEIASQSVYPNTSARNPDTPKRDGYNFLGWYTAPDGGDEWHWNDPVGGNITVYAHWEPIAEATEPTASLTYTELDSGGYVVSGVGQEADIRIPSTYNGQPVVGIGDRAFRYKDITSVSLPSTITSIGMNAFTGCEKLTSVTIPAAVTELANYAFSDCSALTEVIFENGSSLTSIGNRAFAGTDALQSLTIPAGVTSIGSYLLRDSGVTEIVFLGTRSDWNSVNKASHWDYGKTDITITCSDD